MNNTNNELPTIQITDDEVGFHFTSKGKIYLIKRQGEIQLEDNQKQGTLYRAIWGSKSKRVLIKKIAEIQLYSLPVKMYQANPNNLSEPIANIKTGVIRTASPKILEPHAKDSGFDTAERWLHELSKEVTNVPKYPQTETFDLLEVCDFGQYLQNIR